MAKEEYIRWPTDADIPLVLSLVETTGVGSVGKTPEVSIRRIRETHGGDLDNQFWNGTSFVATPVWHPLQEVDPINQPGLYKYLWEQALVGLEWIYTVYYRHTASPVGFAVETHVITNEVYIPNPQPDPIIIGSETIMGQLEIVKGLLHHNAMLDSQVFEEGQLLSARLRMFDNPANIPAVEGGSETTGLLAEFQIESEYDEGGLNKKFVLKRIFP